jgi:hypothetical protein
MHKAVSCSDGGVVMCDIYEAFSMPMTPGGGMKPLFAAEGDVCTGSSTVDVFALGNEELCGL